MTLETDETEESIIVTPTIWYIVCVGLVCTNNIQYGTPQHSLLKNQFCGIENIGFHGSSWIGQL